MNLTLPNRYKEYMARGMFILGANVAYIVLFLVLYPVAGPGAGVMVIFPPAVAGWLLGWRTGLVGGVVTSALSGLLLALSGPANSSVTQGIPGFVVALLSGGVVGWLRHLLVQAKMQIYELAQERDVLTAQVTHQLQAREVLHRQQTLDGSRLKSQILANVSHEVRTPLNAILGYTELLLDGVYGPLSERQYSPISEIMSSAGELLQFVSNLIDQARLESGQIVLNQKSFNPVELLNKVKSTLGLLAQIKELEFTIGVAPDLPASLFGDPYWVQQILVNLAGNAIKFTRQGSVHIQLYRPDDSHWAIEVSDTGPGIALEDQAYIFEAFQQLDGTVTREQGGSGLGLSIVKQLTVLMDGQITLTSQVGWGSTFTVLLPLNPVQEKIV
jgi:signal transduction histidine kinase